MKLFFPGYIRHAVDTIFVAASALSVTGLTSINISETFNLGGYVAIMLIMNLGGIGIMAMGTMVWVLFGRRIGLRERMQIAVDNNQVQIFRRSQAGFFIFIMESQ